MNVDVDRGIETFAKMSGKKIMKCYWIGMAYFTFGKTTISFAEFLMHLTGRVGVGLPPEEWHGCPALSAFLASLPQVRHFSHPLFEVQDGQDLTPFSDGFRSNSIEDHKSRTNLDSARFDVYSPDGARPLSLHRPAAAADADGAVGRAPVAASVI